MSAVLYYLSLPFLYLVSFLPFRIMYLLSDVLYLLVYRVFRYRVKVVTRNLENAFPEKSSAEIDTIRRDFYRYLCDLSLETIKALSMFPATIDKYFRWDDMSVFEHFFRKNQSVIFVMGHLGNWELGGAFFSRQPIHPLYVIYHPLANEHFDGLFQKMRARSGMKTYAMKEAFRGMLKNRNQVTATAFVADQTPTPDKAHWMKFLNQDTPVFKGTETIARKLDYPVIYLAVIREKRGQYSIHSELLTEHPNELADNELTEMHTRRLEQDIIKHPECWLWSHRRWKHRKPG